MWSAVVVLNLLSLVLSSNVDNIRNDKKLEILRSSFDPLDSVMVMSPPLQITTNNSPQTNDSLFRVSRQGTSENPTKSSDSSLLINLINGRIKREVSHYKDNQRYKVHEVYPEHFDDHNSTSDTSEYHEAPQQPSNLAVKPTSASRYYKWAKSYYSYLLIPVVFFIAYAPLALWALKLFVFKGLILSKLAFLVAMYMSMKTLIFGMPENSPIKYYNFGYANDYMNDQGGSLGPVVY